MKRLLIINGFMLLSVLLTTNLFSQERDVYWVHGLNGDATSWERYALEMEQTYMMDEFRPEYYEGLGIGTAGFQVCRQMEDHANHDVSQYGSNIAIGHSQGGIVVREIARNPCTDDVPFGGFITAGAPNQGAAIINSFKSGEIDAFTSDACYNLSEGVANSLTGLLIDWILGYNQADFCNMVTTQLHQAFLNFAEPTTEDYYEGAPFITSLNSEVSSLPSIGISGIEDSPVHWKLITSFALNIPSNLNPDEVNDDDIENVANTAMDSYFDNSAAAKSKALRYKSRAIFFAGLGMFSASTASAIHSNKLFKEAEGWMKGYTWLLHSEKKWLDLIDAQQAGTATEQIYDCVCSGYACFNFDEDCWAWVDHEYPVVTTAPNDGLLRNDVTDLPGAATQFYLEGVNHQELKNHPRMTNTLNSIFQSDSPNISFFRTELRNN